MQKKPSVVRLAYMDVMLGKSLIELIQIVIEKYDCLIRIGLKSITFLINLLRINHHRPVTFKI